MAGYAEIGELMQTIRTPEKELALTAALHDRPSWSSACRKARISRAAFYDWKDSDPDFAKRMDAARNIGLDALEDALVQRGLKNDTTAAIFMLKSLRRDVYGDRVAHTGADGNELTIKVIYADDRASAS